MAGKKNQKYSLLVGGQVLPDGSSNSNKEQEQFLPIANVGRIMKKSLPANAKISKEAKETVQECVSEFISFITGEASDKCHREKRKTVNGDDLLWAMTTLGFENYVSPLKLYLSKFKENDDHSCTDLIKEEEEEEAEDHHRQFIPPSIHLINRDKGTTITAAHHFQSTRWS